MPDIVLKNKNGESVTYEGIETVTFDTPTEERGATFVYGTPLENVPVELNLLDGNQSVTVPDGYFVKSAVIQKPETLLADNIKSGVEIAGVTGNFIGNGQEIEVDLSMADGNQVLTPDEGYLLSKVTVKKPETLIPEHIEKDIEIGGVVGTLVGGNDPTDGVERAVNFFDYDGTLLYSYTLEEAQKLTELPELPTHTGLIGQGWNWTLDDIKSRGRDIDVGALYTTDDGKTRFYIFVGNTIATKLYLTQTVASGVTIDWGDGTTSTPSATSIGITHTYSTAGEYVVTLDVAEGNEVGLGRGTNSTTLFDANTTSTQRYLLKKVEIGERVTSITNYALYNNYCLKTVVMNKGVSTIGTYAFASCNDLKFITIPNGVTSVSGNTCYSCRNLVRVSLPNGLTAVGTYAFSSCYNLKKVTLPDSLLTLNTYCFNTCYGLKDIIFSNILTTIGTYAFYYCYNLGEILLPETVTTIDSSAFVYCYGLKLNKLPDSLTSLGSSAFANTNVNFETLPENMTISNNYGFKDMYSFDVPYIPPISSGTTLSQVCYNCYEATGDENGCLEVPEGITTMSGYNFAYCHKLKKVILPSTLTTMSGRGEFSNCYSMEEIDFSKCTVVPSLSYNDSFQNIPSSCVIKVPSSLLSSWKTATNWTGVASKMVGV